MPSLSEWLDGVIDTFEGTPDLDSYPYLVDGTDWPLAVYLNKLAHAIIDLETSLGIEVWGTETDLESRLAHALDTDGYIDFDAATELTISGGEITVTQTVHKLQPESGTSDNLDTINSPKGFGVLFISDAGTDTITFKHGTGNIQCPGESDVAVIAGFVPYYSDGSTVFIAVGGVASTDASSITFTPAVAADWDGDADPGDLDDALNQLAERVDDLELAPPPVSPITSNMLTRAPDSVGQGTWGVAINSSHLYGGYFRNSPANNGDNFTINFYLPAGTYTLRVTAAKGSSTGILKVEVGATNLGNIDLYAASPDYLYVIESTGISIAANGVYAVKFTANGKNGSSSGYLVLMSQIEFIRTA